MTELGPLPEKWDVRKVGEFATVRGGYGFPHTYQGRPRGEFPFFKVSDMNLPGNEVAMNRANNYIDSDVLAELRARPFPRDTVIFPKIGAAVHTNKKRILTQASLIDNNVMGVTVCSRETCDPRFLFYHFLTVDLGELSSPGPLPSITVQRVKERIVPLPPLPEQRKIAAVLGVVQEAREKTEAVIAAAKELKKSLMKHLFTYGPVPVEQAEKVPLKETEIGPLPEGWQVVSLGDVCSLRKEAVRPSDSPTDIYVGLEHIDSGDPTLKRRGDPKEVKSAKTRFREGEILYGKLRPYLDKAVLSARSGICSTDILVFVPDGTSIAGRFLVNALHTRRFVSYATSTMTGVNHPRTSWASLQKYQLALPPLPEQKRIAAVLSAVDRKIDMLQNKKKALDQLFKTLLNDLMTARIRVKDLDVGN